MYLKITAIVVVLQDEMSYANGKATYKLTVVPTKNLTVSCLVTSKLGQDVKEINVFSRKYCTRWRGFLLWEPLTNHSIDPFKKAHIIGLSRTHLH